jgi:hypothetical protein
VTKATHLVALLQSHIDGDEEQFLTVAMQAAANEARLGHGKVAQQLREMVDDARARGKTKGRTRAVPLVQPRGELANLVAAKGRKKLTPARWKKITLFVSRQVHLGRPEQRPAYCGF